MGAGLVVLALTHRDVSHRSMRVLVAMAVTALDNPRQGQAEAVYYGGWDHLAQVLGYDDASDPTARRQVAKVLADLSSRGLCKPCGQRGRTGGGRGPANYRLTL